MDVGLQGRARHKEVYRPVSWASDSTTFATTTLAYLVPIVRSFGHCCLF